jgi:manganese/zinc/iron transport system ATP- binding protein
MQVSIEAHNISVRYAQKPVLWEIDFHLPMGKIIGILGSNGSGKTTLLKSILGLLPTESGYIQVFGKPIAEVLNKIAYIPQKTSIDWDFPASVMDVVLMARYNPKKWFFRYGQADKNMAAQCLQKVNMLEFANRHISELSGGQQQRVFMARALAQEAALYLLDEPFVGIDTTTEEVIWHLLKDLRNQGKTVVLVHHDLQSVEKNMDYLLLLNTRLVAAGETAHVFNAENLRATFGGQLPILEQLAERIRLDKLPLREQDFQDRQV